MRPATRRRYLDRIERVVDAMLSAPADAHSVESLADVAHMSAFHFHRIYRAVMGETVQTTIRRVRLTLAADRLAVGTQPVAHIAQRAGYESPGAFARAFRSYAHATPLEFRRLHGLPERSVRQRFLVGSEFVGPVDIVDVPACAALAFRHDGALATIPCSFRRFWRWQLRRALLPHVQHELGVIYLDARDPRGLRYYTGVVVNDADRLFEDVEQLTLPGGRYARYRLHGPTAGSIAPAFRAMLGNWLPRSAFVLDERPLLERYVEQRCRPSATFTPVTELLLPVRAKPRRGAHV